MSSKLLSLAEYMESKFGIKSEDRTAMAFLIKKYYFLEGIDEGALNENWRQNGLCKCCTNPVAEQSNRTILRGYCAGHAKEISRFYQWFIRTGITPEEANDLYSDLDDGKCPCCNLPMWFARDEVPYGLKKDRVITIDHCHNSGIWRGMICQKCNQTLGLFKDDADLILKELLIEKDVERIYLYQRLYKYLVQGQEGVYKRISPRRRPKKKLKSGVDF